MRQIACIFRTKCTLYVALLSTAPLWSCVYVVFDLLGNGMDLQPQVEPNKLDILCILFIHFPLFLQVPLPVLIRRRHNHSAVAFGDGSTFTVVVSFGGYGEDSCLSETTLLLLGESECCAGIWACSSTHSSANTHIHLHNYIRST